MPTIRAEFPATLQVKVEVSRDFDLNLHYQLAKALYSTITSMEEDDAVDYLLEAIATVGEGKPTVERAT